MTISAEKANIRELPRVTDRLSFVYLEYCRITRDDNGIKVENDKGSFNLPSASLATILLGPGTTITHRAVELLGDLSTTIVWVGEQGVKYYAHGRPLTHSSALLESQARAVTNRKTRLDVARKMYQMRFPGENVSKLTMQQLRGREGARIRKCYRDMSKETGVEWIGRHYRPEDFSSSDEVNKALSAANACLYGIVHSVIVSLGCSPGLGFIHTGHERSFVYDIADLYKTEITIPLAFRMASAQHKNIGASVRKAMRDEIRSSKMMYRIAHDIGYLLSEEYDIESDFDVQLLWDPEGCIRGGTDYSDDI